MAPGCRPFAPILRRIGKAWHMDQRSEVVARLGRHQPKRWLPWLCSCGRRLPCPARQLALEQLHAWNNRDGERMVMAKLRVRAAIDRAAARMHNQRPCPPTSHHYSSRVPRQDH